MFDLIIIGGGPAGVAAGVYAARKKLKTLLITEGFGGQSTDSGGIENWIGTVNITGTDFSKTLEAHLRFYVNDSVEIKLNKVNKVNKLEVGKFEVGVESGEKFQTKTILIATGSTRRKLEAKGAKEFENKGITYCASCDGPLFTGQDVVVIGGGNAAFETAAQLLAYTNSVTLIHRNDTFRADEVTVEKVLANPKMKAIKSAVVREIKGDKFVNALVYESDGREQELKVSGVFVEIGLIPTTWFVEGLVDLTDIKQIKVNPKTQRASVEGIWAAGDSTDGLYHQNNIAAGDAVKALEDLYLYVHTH